MNDDDKMYSENKVGRNQQPKVGVQSEAWCRIIQVLALVGTPPIKLSKYWGP